VSDKRDPTKFYVNTALDDSLTATKLIATACYQYGNRQLEL